MNIDLDRPDYEAAISRALPFFGKNHDYFTRAKAHRLLEVTQRWVGRPTGLRALDVGCGVGLTDQLLAPWFRELHGVDVSAVSVDAAQRANPSVTYAQSSGAQLPYEDDAFDVSFAVCVMHHVPPPDWQVFLREMRRVVRPRGICIVFEHNPLNPLTRYVVGKCELDKGVTLLGQSTLCRVMTHAGLHTIERNYILFSPVEWAGAKPVERAMGWFPLGAQHYVVATKH